MMDFAKLQLPEELEHAAFRPTEPRAPLGVRFGLTERVAGVSGKYFEFFLICTHALDPLDKLALVLPTGLNVFGRSR